MCSIALTNIYRLLLSCTQNEADTKLIQKPFLYKKGWSIWAHNYFFSQIIYKIHINNLWKNLSLLMYSRNSVNLSHIHNKGAFIYYVNNLGGRGEKPNVYVCWHGGRGVLMKRLLVMLTWGGVSKNLICFMLKVQYALRY